MCCRRFQYVAIHRWHSLIEQVYDCKGKDLETGLEFWIAHNFSPEDCKEKLKGVMADCLVAAGQMEGSFLGNQSSGHVNLLLKKRINSMNRIILFVCLFVCLFVVVFPGGSNLR